LKRVDEIEKLLPPNLALAGSSYRGIAVPDCIRQGREAARKLSS
jgi:oxygen-dependent protoporphyrinogen oxidase